MNRFEFDAELWRWTGQAAWHFVTLPHEIADDIDEITADTRRGFGSVRVAEALDEGCSVGVGITLLDP